MPRCRNILKIVALVALLTAASSREARAELIDYGGGMIYDSVQDLTWLDPAFVQPPHTSMVGDAQTCPGPCDWYYTWTGATAWVDGLSYGGHNDWRLPSRTDPTSFGGDNELHRMLAQLSGWSFGPNFHDSVELLTRGESGPFASIPEYYFVWMHNDTNVYTHYMGYDFPDHADFRGQVRAVRQGAPTSSVPEPTTFGLLALGALGLGVGRRVFRPKP